MVIFNHTFTDDKPIYFPDNWETGKTALQLHEEWKLTLQYYILSNITESVFAAAWITIAIVIAIAAKELKRLSDLDNENREKKENKKYLRMDFLIPVIVITAIWVGCTITYAAMAISNLLSLLKGAALLLFARATYSIYQKYSPAFRRWKKEKSRSAEKKKENEKLQVHSD